MFPQRFPPKLKAGPGLGGCKNVLGYQFPLSKVRVQSHLVGGGVRQIWDKCQLWVGHLASTSLGLLWKVDS